MARPPSASTVTRNHGGRAARARRSGTITDIAASVGVAICSAGAREVRNSLRKVDEPGLPRVTPSLLRAADTRCARRLAREFGDEGRGSSSPVNRARLRDAFLNAARRAHVDLRAPATDDFPTPEGLEPEEGAVFAQAARWYVAHYPRPVRTYFHELDEPTRRRGVRVGGWVDLTVEEPDGRKELRQLDLWGGPPRGADPLDDERIRMALLRLARWVDGGVVCVSWADLVHGHAPLEREVDLGAELPALVRWFDERVAVVRERTAVPRAEPGRDCGTCTYVAGCPAHPTGAHGSTPRGDPRPGIITLTPTALDRWARCRREWRGKALLSLPESDPSTSAGRGRLVHDLLRFVHTHGSCRDDAHVDRALVDHGVDADGPLREALARHVRRCPETAEALGHEREVARFHRVPLPLFMATARIDALWAHDGVLDARDYKTGGGALDRVGDDPKARVQAWVLAPEAAARGLRLRVRYEQLATEHDDDPEPYEPDDDDLAAVEEELRVVVSEMWAEQHFDGVADPATCAGCCYRSICPDSAVVSAPAWPVPA